MRYSSKLRPFVVLGKGNLYRYSHQEKVCIDDPSNKSKQKYISFTYYLVIIVAVLFLGGKFCVLFQFPSTAVRSIEKSVDDFDATHSFQ